MSKSRSIPLLIVAFALVFEGCSDLAADCGKDEFRRTELFDTQIAVDDTTDVRRVFETYKAHLALENLPFPDGAEDWVYIDSSEFFADGKTQYWLIEYLRTDNKPINTIATDSQGIVLWLKISVHAPC